MCSAALFPDHLSPSPPPAVPACEHTRIPSRVEGGVHEGDPARGSGEITYVASHDYLASWSCAGEPSLARGKQRWGHHGDTMGALWGGCL